MTTHIKFFVIKSIDNNYYVGYKLYLLILDHERITIVIKYKCNFIFTNLDIINMF